LTSAGCEQDGNDRLSLVSLIFFFSLVTDHYYCNYFFQASLKKVMTMLGRVWHRQVDDDLTLDGRRPASSMRGSDFYKALMVESQQL
jgi:hypothetical protein